MFEIIMSELFIPHKIFSSFVFDEIGKFKLKEAFSQHGIL